MPHRPTHGEPLHARAVLHAHGVCVACAWRVRTKASSSKASEETPSLKVFLSIEPGVPLNCHATDGRARQGAGCRGRGQAKGR